MTNSTHPNPVSTFLAEHPPYCLTIAGEVVGAMPIRAGRIRREDVPLLMRVIDALDANRGSIGREQVLEALKQVTR